MKQIIMLILVASLIFSGCALAPNVPEDQHPQTMDEFEAEATVYAMVNRVNMDTARQMINKLYPEFDPVLTGEDPQPVMGIPKIYTFIECEDSDGGDLPVDAGTVYATFMDGNVKKRAQLKDSCSGMVTEGTAVEYYCSGNRPARRTLECVCWDERSCK